VSLDTPRPQPFPWPKVKENDVNLYYSLNMVRLPEIIVILLAVWRPLRAALDGRFSTAFPAVAVKLRLIITILVLLTAAVFLFAPLLLHAGALGAAVFIAAERWRARPAWGRKRGLPPGSLGIFPNNWTSDRFYLKLASKHGPIFKTSNFLHPTVCIVGFERGLALLREHEGSLATPPLPFSKYVPGGLLRYMRHSEHKHYRAILRRAFSPQLSDQLLPAFADTVKRALLTFSRESAAVEDGLAPFPCIDRLMLDFWFPLFFAIEPASEQGRLLRSLLLTIDINNPTRASPEQIHSAVGKISALVEGQLDSWQGSPPTCLLGAVMADNEADARDPVLIGNLIYLLHTSSTDMSGLLCWLLKKMSDNPEWLERLALEPHWSVSSGPSSLAQRIVMETLRMRQSEFLYRSAASDIDFQGFHIPRGWLIRICVWESHQNPDVFTNPERFDADRFLDRSYTRLEYSPFGASSHACLASYLVMRVGSVFVSELATGFRLTTPSAGLVELGKNRHWEPGKSYRIQLTERQ